MTSAHAPVPRYLVFPGGDPRWVLPSDGSSLGQAFSMYRPSRLAPRFATRILSLGSRLSGGAALRLVGSRCSSEVTEQIDFVIDQARQHLGVTGDHAVAWLGAAGPDRKMTVAILHGNDPLLYSKIAVTRRARDSVRAEAQVLRSIRGTRVGFHAPELGSLCERDDMTALFVAPVSGLKASARARPDARHAQFLIALSEVTTGVVGHWIEALATRVALLRCPASTRNVMLHGLDLAADNNVLRSSPLVLAHGDFTPWNCFLGQTLQAIDWEYAGPRPPAWDLFHWFVQREVHTRSRSLHRSVKSVLNWRHQVDVADSFREVAFSADSSARRVLLLYLVDSLAHILEGRTEPHARAECLRLDLIAACITDLGSTPNGN